MWQSFKPFFEWSDKMWLGRAIADTIWAFPVIETIHILALTMMFGAIVIIDLRMFGLGLRKQPVAVLAKNLATDPELHDARKFVMDVADFSLR